MPYINILFFYRNQLNKSSLELPTSQFYSRNHSKLSLPIPQTDWRDRKALKTRAGIGWHILIAVILVACVPIRISAEQMLGDLNISFP